MVATMLSHDRYECPKLGDFNSTTNALRARRGEGTDTYTSPGLSRSDPTARMERAWGSQSHKMCRLLGISPKAMPRDHGRALRQRAVRKLIQGHLFVPACSVPDTMSNPEPFPAGREESPIEGMVEPSCELSLSYNIDWTRRHGR